MEKNIIIHLNGNYICEISYELGDRITENSFFEAWREDQFCVANELAEFIYYEDPNAGAPVTAKQVFD